ADQAILYQPDNLGWDMSKLLDYADNIRITSDLETIIELINAESNGTCHVLLMSNGSFGGIYQRLKAQYPID
ncbi:MAG: hypothetical protein RL563_2198, partial [Pseudomonadota bacterium]